MIPCGVANAVSPDESPTLAPLYEPALDEPGQGDVRRQFVGDDAGKELAIVGVAPAVVHCGPPEPLVRVVLDKKGDEAHCGASRQNGGLGILGLELPQDRRCIRHPAAVVALDDGHLHGTGVGEDGRAVGKGRNAFVREALVAKIRLELPCVVRDLRAVNLQHASAIPSRFRGGDIVARRRGFALEYRTQRRSGHPRDPKDLPPHSFQGIWQSHILAVSATKAVVFLAWCQGRSPERRDDRGDR